MRIFTFEFRELNCVAHVEFSDVVLFADAAFEDEVQPVRVGVAVGIESADDDLVDGRFEYLPMELIDFLVPEDGFLERLQLPLYFGLLALSVLIKETPINPLYTKLKNGEIDSLLARIGIKRSLSNPGCPYDNACAETLFGKTKIEFVRNKVFKSMDEVKLELFQYVWWYNNKRLHSSLGYLSPVAYKNKNKFVQI